MSGSNPGPGTANFRDKLRMITYNVDNERTTRIERKIFLLLNKILRWSTVIFLMMFCGVLQVCKEEEEAIRVDLHEGCGRTKLFWLLALADKATLQALVEFRGTTTNPTDLSVPVARTYVQPARVGVCRYCGMMSNDGLLAIGNVCANDECQVPTQQTDIFLTRVGND